MKTLTFLSRSSVALLAILFAFQALGCKSDGDDAPDVDGAVMPDTGDSNQMVVETPEVSVAPGEERQYCFHFRFDNTDEAMIQAFASSASGAVSSVQLQMTSKGILPAGTLETVSGLCGPATEIPEIVYRTVRPETSWSFPADDGTGKPVGKPLKAGQAAILAFYVHNETVNPMTARVSLSVTRYAPGTLVTRAEPYYVTNLMLSIPPQQATIQEMFCKVPNPTAKFISMQAFAHSRAVRMSIQDLASSAVAYDTMSFSDPQFKTFDAPFFSFTGATPDLVRLNLRCAYINNTDSQLQSGTSELFDEQCDALLYSFPADKPRLCVNGFN